MRTSGAQIVVVGDGPEREAAMAAARRLGLAERVHFTGFRPHREIPAILDHTDVFAMPSVYEELGSVLLETMQAGLPIVASRTGGSPKRSVRPQSSWRPVMPERSPRSSTGCSRTKTPPRGCRAWHERAHCATTGGGWPTKS